MTVLTAVATDDAGCLSEAEKHALHVANLLEMALYALTAGPAEAEDRAEVRVHVHALQNMVLAQAAARAYPDLHRLLGG